MHAHASADRASRGHGPVSVAAGSMREDAALAYPAGAGPSRYHHYDAPNVLIGPDFRNAYTTPDLTAHGQPPYSGSNPAGDTDDRYGPARRLEPQRSRPTWAIRRQRCPGYSAAEDLTMVPVDQADVPAPSADDDGDTEVDLDQEAILGTDPFAHQRPYFAPNSGAGYSDALAQVARRCAAGQPRLPGRRPPHRRVVHLVGLVRARYRRAVDQCDGADPGVLVAAGVTIFGPPAMTGSTTSAASPVRMPTTRLRRRRSSASAAPR